MVGQERIRAAGGVVWRAGASGTEVCLVHRPRHDDWSLPKGKLEPGEHPLAAAVREVAEEAGLGAVPQVRLPSVRYRVREGTPKQVDFWSMRCVSEDGFLPGDEVDGVRWLPVRSAVEAVSYPQDARVLGAFAGLPPVAGTVALVRHGSAGRPGSWPGADAARPLDEAGRAEARALAPLLAVLAPDRLVSAPARRCLQTLTPLAALLDLPIDVDAALGEPSGDPAAAARSLDECASSAASTVACGQPSVIPPALALLTGAPPQTYASGMGWLLAFSTAGQVFTDRLALDEGGG